MTDWIDELERVTRLHKGGALSDDEFAVQKAQILGRARESSRSVEPQYEAAVRTAPAISATTIAVGILAAVVLGLLIWAFVSSGIEPREVEKDSSVGSARAVQEQAPVAVTQPQAQPTMVGMPTFAPPSVELPPPPATTYNPSFRCTNNQSNVLRMICTSRELSERDRQLSAMFKIVLAEIPVGNRSKLLATQRRLLAERDMCGNVYCISRWYEQTIGYYAPYFADDEETF